MYRPTARTMRTVGRYGSVRTHHLVRAGGGQNHLSGVTGRDRAIDHARGRSLLGVVVGALAHANLHRG